MSSFKYLLLTLSVFCMFSLHATAQISNAPEQNCIGGIPVCQDVYNQPNAYSGSGTITELDAANQDCLSEAEKNAVWYILNITASGSISFLITPNQSSDDYDWALWDITNGGCPLIYNYTTNTTNPYPPVRCNYSGTPNTTGMTAAGVNASEAAGGIPYSTTLNVTAGQTLALCVSNFTASQSGYKLDFTASTAAIFDTVRPKFQNVADFCSNSDSIVVSMNKPVQCSSLDADGSNLFITPAVAGVTITSAGSVQCQVGGTATTTFTVRLSGALPLGTYILHAKNGGDGNTLLSSCGYAQSTDDSIAFNILSTPLLSVNPADTSICVNGATQLNVTVLNPATGITYSYSWSPNQHISDSSSAHPVVSPLLPTNYTVTVAENGSAACLSSKTVNVNVLQGFNLPTKDTSICNGTSFKIQNIGDTNYFYHWTPVTWLSNPNIMNPVASPAATTTYTVTASYPGCADSSQSIHIAVGISPIINAGPDTTTCINDTLQLHVDILNNSPTYAISWVPNQYMNDNTSTDPKVSPSGNITYVVTVTDTANTQHCSTADTVNVTVLQGFILYNNDTVICQGASVQLNVTGDAKYHFAWTPTNWLSNPNIASPVATPDSSIAYTVTSSFPGCTDKSRSVTIEVQPNPIVIAGSDVAMCEWSKVTLHGIVTPSYPGYIYQWSPGQYLFDSTVLAPTYYGDSSVTLHFIVTTSAGCKGEDSAMVTVWPGRYGQVSNDTAICPGESASLVASGGISYAWIPDLGLSDSSSATPIATPTVTTRYTVYMKDTHDCADTNAVTVTVYPGAVIDMPDSVTIYPGETYHIQPQTNCVAFQWFPLLGLSNAIISDPVASPAVNTRYVVHAATEWGCKTVDSMDVLVDPNTLLTLPNAFAPGNGPNNLFKIIKRGIATLQTFRIYDRWGVVVFQTTNIDEGWDGTFNGSPQPTGVYIYMVEATSSTHQHFVKNGNVTLLR